MKKTKAEKFKFLPSSRACLFSSFTNNTFSKHLAPCMSMTEQIPCLLQNVGELLIWSSTPPNSHLQVLPTTQRCWAIFALQPAGVAFSIPLKPDCRLSVSSVVLQQVVHEDLLGTSTARYEKLNGKDKNPSKTKERRKIWKEICSTPSLFKCGRISHHHDFF